MTEAKYKVTEHRGGVSSSTAAANLKDVASIVSYLLRDKAPGASINVTIKKNK